MPTSRRRLSSSTSDLETVLERSRDLGFLGPGPVTEHVEHAQLFAPPLEALSSSSDEGRPLVVADLGAGGGVPSLPLAVRLPTVRFVLVDSSQRRVSFLVWAAVELGVAERVEAWCGRAEDFGHIPDRREHFDAVVARGFGPPASTVECAAPLLRPGGRCVISEPPGGRRWPTAGLELLGLSEGIGTEGVVVLDRVGYPEARFPRPAKAQKRSPLFTLDR